MKFFFAPYFLKPKSRVNSKSLSAGGLRAGALLKVDFGEGVIGYADCHPIVELGDPSLEDQLASLKRGNLTPQVSRSLYFAKLDAGARSEKRNLWDGLKIPENHILLTSVLDLSGPKLLEWRGLGKTRVKIKLGFDYRKEARTLQDLEPFFFETGIRCRLDFNGSLTPEQLEEFLSIFDPRFIDFIEDPISFHASQWRDIQNKFKVRLALDRVPSCFPTQGLEGSYSVFILKPAVQTHSEWRSKPEQEVVVTSYMDHPFGQLCAAWEASLLLKKGLLRNDVPCGLMTHLCFEPVDQSLEFRSVFGSESLNPPNEGTGFGLDRFLEAQEWKEL